MPNFSPSSEIHIGRVPWDASYRHTRTFSSASSQTSWMKGRCTNSLTKDNYTYVRMNNSIRVPFNAERLYTYNYVMYQNANYGSKWFYAFIVGVNYVNENMTELVLELDVMQTWMFDYTLTRCFVEREHVNDDTIGAHLNPEPAMELEWVYQTFQEHVYTPKYAVFLATQYPHYNNTLLDPQQTSAGDAYSGHVYYGQYSAARAYLYDLDDNDSIAAMRRDLEAWNKCGSAEAIVDAFTIPANAVKQDDLYTVEAQIAAGSWYTMNGVYSLNEDYGCPVHGSDISRPTDIDGYTPHNNKLFTYPYCYIEVGDFCGRKQDYRWEFFDLDGTTYKWARFEVKIPGISDGTGYLTPKNYNGVGGYSTLGTAMYTEPFTFSFGNKISWIYSVYQNWAAQNAVNNNLAVIGGTAAIMTGAFAGAGAASAVLGAGALAGEAATLMNAGYPNFAAMASNDANALRGKASAQGKAALGAAGGGAMAVGGVIGNVEKMKRVPNQARGNLNGNSRLQCGYNGYYQAKVVIREEFARIVDGFFDMYGYEVDRVKVPNVTGRANWNYVKCNNSCHRGNVPADHMTLINQIYDKGITFWHTDDIGNYSLSNGIV